jgi:hypothetical protein
VASWRKVKAEQIEKETMDNCTFSPVIQNYNPGQSILEEETS